MIKDIIEYEVWNGHEDEIRTIDLNKELPVEDFLKFGWTKYTYNELTDNNNIGMSMNVVEGITTKDKNEHCQGVYLLTVNGKVVKIGGTETGLAKRWGSYNNGTKKIRMGAGNGSVTNYYIIQALKAALKQGYIVEWYFKKMDYIEEEVELYSGEVIQNRLYPNGQYKDHEKDLLSYYESITGFHPVLSSNK
tara:strand:+ start:208 stop:783 length:576 start_codon:yes stop_codon:yes gene_type:complete